MTFLDGGGAETPSEQSARGPDPSLAPDAPVVPRPTLPPIRLPEVVPRPAAAPLPGQPVPEAPTFGAPPPGAPGMPPALAELMARVGAQGPTTTPAQRAKLRRRRRRRRRLVLSVLLTAGGLVYQQFGTTIREHLHIGAGAEDDAAADGASPTTARPQTVTSWDPRVAEIVAFVEHERGLTFDHPVPVDFLPEAEFVALFTEPADATASAVDAEAAAAQAAADRAVTAWYDDVGLAVGYAPAEGDASFDAIATLGFYTPYEDRVYVRGDQLTPAVRTVLAHELTHALQAQHFDLHLGGDDDLTVRSIVEADAMRVEEAYVATLPAADQDATEAENSLGASEEAELASVPWAVVESRYAPYVIGPTLVTQAYDERGNAGVDALLADPPTEEVLISPWLRNVPQTEVLPPVTVPAGATVVLPEQRLSMFDMIVMLDAWLSWTQARSALDGWAGGRMVMYQYGEGGPICEGATIAFDASAGPMAEALTAWAAAAGSTLMPAIVDRQVTFEACPRAVGAPSPPEPVVSPIESIVMEHVIVGDIDAAVSPEAVALGTCYARRLIDDPSLAPLMFDADLDADEEAIMDWVTTAAADSCGLLTGG